GHMALEHIGFNPLVLVEEVMDLFFERAYQKGLDLAAYVAPDIPRHLFGDPHRLRQILCNFVSNALKFTTHGSVLVEISWLASHTFAMAGGQREASEGFSASSQNSLGTVRFAVKDTGIGMTQPVQQKIFQVFTQADSSMSRKFGGSGLGLAICKQLAELMNGVVGVESVVGEGSTFWCDLPFHRSDLLAEKASLSIEDRQQPVLICAPWSASIEVLSRYLKDLGVHVSRVETISDAEKFFLPMKEASSDVLRVIVGRVGLDEAWLSWLKTLRTSQSERVKLWGLTPFWLRKSPAESPGLFDEMMTLPIHRETFIRSLCPGMEEKVTVDRISQSVTQKLICHEPERLARVDQPVLGVSHRETWPGPSVLIVEDNPVNQKVAVGLFEKLGCLVSVAESGDQALTLIQEQAVDVVMMDWELPGMDGFETARAIRALESTNRLQRSEAMSWLSSESRSRPCSHLPIVGMTAHGQTEKNQFRWRPFMDDCLAKPIHMQDLAQVLERWVGFKVPPGNHLPLSSEEADVPGARKRHGREESFEKGPRPASMALDSSVHLYDFSGALTFMEGDEGLLYSLFQIFLETAPDLMQGIQSAMASQDRSSVQRHVHQLKGALCALHASHLAERAERLEGAALVDPFPDLQDQVHAMKREVEALMTLLRTRLSEVNALVEGPEHGNRK
ncbi:MAG: ATP-binding protein, partial [Nitrospirota bacterium]|nr:ATP-binding protein [Nitrospirota bacterium]